MKGWTSISVMDDADLLSHWEYWNAKRDDAWKEMQSAGKNIGHLWAEIIERDLSVPERTKERAERTDAEIGMAVFAKGEGLDKLKDDESDLLRDDQ